VVIVEREFWLFKVIVVGKTNTVLATITLNGKTALTDNHDYYISTRHER
jgi:hypothetical protein